MRAIKVNRQAVEALVFWLIYHEMIATIISLIGNIEWWWLQPFVVIMSLFTLSITLGSQTREEHDGRQ
jgi:hypothetical protein